MRRRGDTPPYQYNVCGNGTLVYATTPSGLVFTDSEWHGVLWLRNCAIAGLVPADMANANSTLRLTDVTGYFNTGNNTSTCAGTLELVDDGATNAFVVDNGWSDYGITVFAKLKGDGIQVGSVQGDPHRRRRMHAQHVEEVPEVPGADEARRARVGKRHPAVAHAPCRDPPRRNGRARHKRRAGEVKNGIICPDETDSHRHE